MRRHKAAAGGFLAVAAAGWASTHWFLLPAAWLGYIRAATEAGMIGGLADWFAVTALFRRPLGLPIPHTNLIANNQLRIAQGVARYIDSQFLERGALTNQIRSIDIADRISALLNDKANQERIADGLMKFIPRALEGRRDGVIVEAITAGLRKGLAESDLRPVFRRLTRDIVNSDDLLHLLNSLCRDAQNSIEAHRPQILEKIEKESHWYIPAFFDRKFADGLISAGIKLLEAIQDPETDEGKALRKWLSNLPAQVEHSEMLGPKLFDVVRRFLSGREVESIVGSVWNNTKMMINSDIAAEESHIRAALLSFLDSISSETLDSVAFRKRINETIGSFIVEKIPGWCEKVCKIISETLADKKPEEFSESIELQIGKELQYIRINGTIIGALIGVVLYWLNVVLGTPIP